MSSVLIEVKHAPESMNEALIIISPASEKTPHWLKGDVGSIKCHRPTWDTNYIMFTSANSGRSLILNPQTLIEVSLP